MKTTVNSQDLSKSFWHGIDFFEGFAPEVLREILVGAEIIDTTPKKTVFYEGDPADHFGFVIEGVFKLYRADQLGNRVIMDFVKSGGLVAGLLMASEDSTYPVTLQSVNSGKFLKIPKVTYNNFWCQRPEIIRKFQNASMQRVQSSQILRDSQRFPLEQKVAWVLTKLLVDKDANGFQEIYFSRVDIADAVGAASESVIRVFSKWLKDGVVVVKDGGEFADLKKIGHVLDQSD